MVNGMINVYKEKGFTSHDVVAKLRGIVGQRKIGHTGTLDPDATGVLPVCLGRGTKLCDLLTNKNKTYEAVLLLGQETDTQDTSGEVLHEIDTSHITKEQVEKCIGSFIGISEQVPPMYSALKINGQKLCDLARQGKTVERKPRQINIHSINVLDVDLPRVKMEVTCSKGTYIRTLCHDIGNELKVYGCMEKLVRTRVSTFAIQDSLTLGQLQELKDNDNLQEAIMPIDAVLQDLEQIVLPENQEFLALNGNPLNMEALMESEMWEDSQSIRVYLKTKELLGVYTYRKENGTLKLKQMFLDK